MGVWCKCTIRTQTFSGGYDCLPYAFWRAHPTAGAPAESICVPRISIVEYQPLLQLFLPWHLSIRRSRTPDRQRFCLYKWIDRVAASASFAGIALSELSTQLSFFF